MPIYEICERFTYERRKRHLGCLAGMMKDRRKWMIFASGFIFIFSLFFSNHSKEVLARSNQAVVSVTSAYDEGVRKPIDIAVMIQGAGQLTGGVVELQFDEDVSRLKNISAGDVLNSGSFIVFDNLADEERSKGTVKVSFAGAEEVSEDGILINLEFELWQRNGETPIEIKNIELYDKSLNEMNVAVNDGEIGSFKGKSQKKEGSVSGEKDWTISFSSQIHPSSVNRHTIYVVNQRTNEKLPVKLVLSNDRKSLQVQSPGSGYASGDYILYVSNHAKSPGGIPLKEAVKMEFSVQ
jgi:hypothetical protein